MDRDLSEHAVDLGPLSVRYWSEVGTGNGERRDG